MKKSKGILFYLKSYKFNSVLIKNFTIVLILFLFPVMVVGYFYYANTKDMLNNEIGLENKSLALNVRKFSDELIKQADYIATYVMSTDNVQMFMVNDWFNDDLKSKDTGLTNFVNMVPLLYNSIDSIYIYSETNNMVNTSGGVAGFSDHQDKNWYPIYEKLDNPKMVIVPRVRNDIFPQYISLIRPVFESDEKLGCIVVNMNVQKILKLFFNEKYEGERRIFIANSEGTILMSMDREDFAKNVSEVNILKDIDLSNNNKTNIEKGDSEFVISTEFSDYYDLIYINASSINIYANRINQIWKLLLILTLILIIVSFLISVIVAVNSFKPMCEIISVLEEPEKFNDFTEGVRTGNLNELKYIIGSMVKTFQHTSQIENELSVKLVQMDKSHFAMLQAQINPHFLYNTLETINWMAVNLSEKADNPVSDALYNLGEFFRLNTQSTNYFVSLGDEIRQTQIYTQILKLRYEDLFEVEWDFESNLLDIQVIKITLQPFIENSVYHGIKPKGKGKIIITGRKEHEKVILSVVDDGVGMTEDKVKDFLKTLNTDFKDNDKHIGLYNVYRRYRIVFGDKCHIDVVSKVNEGTAIKLSFPAVNFHSYKDNIETVNSLY